MPPDNKFCLKTTMSLDQPQYLVHRIPSDGDSCRPFLENHMKPYFHPEEVYSCVTFLGICDEQAMEMFL